MENTNYKIDNQRKKLLIDPPFQKSFLKYTVGSALGLSLFYFVGIQVFFWWFKSQGNELQLSPDHIFFQYLDEQLSILNLIFVFTTLLITTGLFMYGLYMSNQIAGPIFHLKNYLKSVRESGNTKELQFRDTDYFYDMSEDVNKTIRHLKKA